MEKIVIKQPVKGAKTVRIANNLLNSKNENIILDMLILQQKLLKDYNGEGRSKLDKVNSYILDNFYRIVENTNCKDNLITSHNGNYRYSKELFDLCSSPSFIINTGDSLKNDKSKDVVTEDFRKCKDACEDEKMQKVAFWANRIAHGCTDEIATFTEQYMGVSNTEDEAEKKKKIFLKRVYKANEYFTNQPEYRFNQSRLSLLIKKDDFDFESCIDPDFLKAKDLMREAKIPCRDKIAVKNFIYCNKLQNMTNNFYAFKDNAVENLILHLNDPQIDEEDKHIEAFRIKDRNMKGRNGESLSRIVLANKSMYDQYLKYNDSVNFTDKHIDSFSDNGYVNDSHKRKIRGELKSIFSDRNIDTNCMNALMEKCSVSVFHVPDKALDKFTLTQNIQINDTYPPIVECMAYNGGNIYDITPSQKKEKGLEEYLRDQQLRNLTNEKRYNENFEKMYSEKKIEKKAKSIVQNIQNRNVIGGNI